MGSEAEPGLSALVYEAWPHTAGHYCLTQRPVCCTLAQSIVVVTIYWGSFYTGMLYMWQQTWEAMGVFMNKE